MDKDDDYTAMGEPVEAKPKRRADKPNPLMECLKATFSKYFPRKKKRAWTDAGKWMRFVVGIAAALHFVALAFCLLLVGPISSSFNILLQF